MQADALGNGLIEEIGTDGFADVGPQFILGIALGENVEGEALGTITPIGFLRDLEDQFGHAFIFASSECRGYLRRASP
jgi:hypothetical protein